MTEQIEMLVRKAKDGDKNALEMLVEAIQNPIYGLALRMLYDPGDAEDAAQEILVKIITHLGTFQEQSAFSTWVYRVATNHLLTTRKRRAEREALSFDAYEQSLDLEAAGQWRESQSDALQKLFVDEIRISCLQGLLLCLDREHRLAFLLVDVFEVNSEQGAAILDITTSAFRKRLSRARDRLQEFLTKNCGLIHPENPCSCEYHAALQFQTRGFHDDPMLFANHPCRIRHGDRAIYRLQEMDELNRIGWLYQHNPDFRSPGVFIEHIRRLVNSEKYELL